MYQTGVPATTNLPYSNGHLSPPPAKPVPIGPTRQDSESDLSEAIDLPNAPTSVSKSEQYDVGEDVEMQESEGGSSHDEDAMGSDDPDYNMATPPPGNTGSGRDARSSSQDSPRQRKRKAGIEPDDYMLNDPELYGLRRSVSSKVSRPEHLTNSWLSGSTSPITPSCKGPFLCTKVTILMNTLD